MKHPSYGAGHTYRQSDMAFFSAYAIKIEKQAYQLAEGIVVSQLKTVLNDKFGAYFYFKKNFSRNFDLSESWLKINRSKQYFILKSQLFLLTKVDDYIYKKCMIYHALQCIRVQAIKQTSIINNAL